MPSHHRPPFPTQAFMEALRPVAEFFQGFRLKGPHWEPSTLRALACCELPPNPRVADLGCGAGASALLLARELRVPILALDAFGPFLDELWVHAQNQGLGNYLELVSGDMAKPPVEMGSLDLIWCEGAMYHLGWSEALSLWAPLLQPGGYLCASDLCWFSDEPNPELITAWSAEFPGVDITLSLRLDTRLRQAHEVGYDLVTCFQQPPQAWLDYYAPIRERCRERPEDPMAQGMEAEIALYERFGNEYGYIFFVLKRRS